VKKRKNDTVEIDFPILGLVFLAAIIFLIGWIGDEIGYRRGQRDAFRDIPEKYKLVVTLGVKSKGHKQPGMIVNGFSGSGRVCAEFGKITNTPKEWFCKAKEEPLL